jgi:hypothetical protein
MWNPDILGEPDLEATEEMVYDLAEALEWALDYILEVAGKKAEKEPMYETGRLLLEKLGA